MLENIDLREYLSFIYLSTAWKLMPSDLDNFLKGRSEIIVDLNMIYRSTSQIQRELKHCLRFLRLTKTEKLTELI